MENLLLDEPFRSKLAERSRRAYEKYFSWAAIVERFAEELHLRENVPDMRKVIENKAVAGI
jgi:glycosyltransferase involved in cell wall biosynthesis